MSAQQVLTQKVNFVISAAFIFVFGLFLTITVVQAINRNSDIFQNFSTSADMAK